MAFALSSSALLVAVICFVLAQRAPAADTKDEKHLRKLEQQESPATAERDEAAINALHNLFTEEDRLLKYLTSPMDGDYEFVVPKRSCLRRGTSCDGRRGDCCESLACRCNLWGTNCRCQRIGLLQRLG